MRNLFEWTQTAWVVLLAELLVAGWLAVPFEFAARVLNVGGATLMSATTHQRFPPVLLAPMPPPRPRDEEAVLLLSERPLQAEVRRPGLLGAVRHVPAPPADPVMWFVGANSK